jgi:hypothetical protein
MLKWFDEDPLAAVRRSFAQWLDSQVRGSELVWLVAEDAPHWMTIGAPHEEDASKVRITRTAFAFAFRLLVRTPQGEEGELDGVFTWALWGLNTFAPEQRIWIDVGGDLAALGKGGALEARIYHDQSRSLSTSNRVEWG